jgi:hypothetical protein
VTENDADTGRSTEPWFADACAAARLRKGSRVLMLTAPSPEQVHAVLAAIGEDGSLTILEPDSGITAALDGILHPNLAVLAYDPDGKEVFGVHDALLACPRFAPRWPLNRYGELALGNLRPGATFVLDLPAPESCTAVREAAAEIGLAPDAIAGLNGPGTGGLVRLLRADGLRNVEAAATTHLVRFENPHALARYVAAGQPKVDESAVASLQLAFARRFGTNDEIEVPIHRERVVAMR